MVILIQGKMKHCRFGHLYLKVNPENVPSANSTIQEWMRSKSLRKAAFNTQ